MVIISPFDNCPSIIFLHVVMMNQNCHLSAKRLYDYAVQVSCDQIGGEGGVSQNITFDHRGGGGALERAQI